MGFIKNILRLNWSATIKLNYKAGGMRAVIRMPIKVYGKLKCNVTGSIILSNDAVRSSLVIGSRHEDYTAAAGKAEINISGKLVVDGIIRIGPDCFIGVRKDGVLCIGDGTFIGRDSQIHCSKNITIGNDVFMGETYMTDSDEHLIIKDGVAQELYGRVVIGEGTYLGFRSQLLKGTAIPPQSVVASGAVCKKDFTCEASGKVLIAGVPATIKASNVEAQK